MCIGEHLLELVCDELQGFSSTRCSKIHINLEGIGGIPLGTLMDVCVQQHILL